MALDDPKKNLIRGAAWTVGTRWVIKALRFINTIMARLQIPKDYGIVAMGMLVVSLIQTLACQFPKRRQSSVTLYQKVLRTIS